MRKISQEELNNIIECHRNWLFDKDVPKSKKHQADLRDVDLSGVDLSNVNLTYANLIGANLRGAHLRFADLSDADLRGADLIGANLSDAHLIGANLSDADLRGADLINAILAGADLSDADLRGADLRGADLNNAHLRFADLNNTNFENALPHIACPENGSFIGYKKAQRIDGMEECIIILEIPEDAKRSSATRNKCRCNKAKVLDIMNLNGQFNGILSARSLYDSTFVYKVGETIEVSDFDDCRWHECAPGIHFFMDLNQAIDY